MLVPVSRLGVASMRTHYHVKQDGRLAPGRQPRDAQPGRWPSGFPRSDQGPGGALCPAMGVSVGSLGRRASAGRSAGPKNAGVEWCHFQFPYYIYTRVRCYLIHTHTFRCPFDDAVERPLDVALGGTSSFSCRAGSHTPPAGSDQRQLTLPACCFTGRCYRAFSGL